MTRAVLIAAVLLLQGCGAFSQLREELDELYSNPAMLARGVAVVEDAPVTPLDAPAFTGSYGRKGLWQPVSFIKEKRDGVYLLAPYDRAKVPVLFIHGAGGTPQDWRYFIERLDRTKYQAWVYYYPTGMPIELSALRLNRSVAALHAKYGFKQLVVTGHSMGGLVARRFIALSAGEGQDYARLLVTFATPWGGVPFARIGIALAPQAIPSWKDLVPESDLLRSLQVAALPPAVKHHLFYGYRDRGDAFDSDGVITVASQLEEHVQAGAARTHGFKTDHSAILGDGAVFRRFASVLASLD